MNKNETIAAMLDAEKIAKDSSIKGNKDLDEFFEEFQKELFDCQAGYVNENISVINIDDIYKLQNTIGNDFD